jgi:hypothetical protein
MFVQMISKFHHHFVETRRNRNEIQSGQMLNQFAEPNAARVRTNWDPAFRRHQHDSDDFVDAADSARINLAKSDRVRLKQLLENHSIGAMFAGRDADAQRPKRFGNFCVAFRIKIY